MNVHDMTRRHALVLLAALLPATGTQADDSPDPQASPRWQQVRRSLFGTRVIHPGDGVIVLEAPPRAEDAAVVPVALLAQFPQTAGRHIRQLVLVIDNNPSPIAAIFHFTPDSGRADIATRVRVDEYSFMRAVAETSDGQLYMSSRFVKASGGCAAPPGKDPVAAQASLGRMRLRAQRDPRGASLRQATLMIRHPNDSGLAMDPLTRQYTPAHFVRQVDVSYANRPVLSADLDIAISENPHLVFHFIAQPPDGELRARIVDSKEQHFEQALMLGSPS